MNSPVRTSRNGLRKLMEFAVASGWSVSRSAGGHIKFTKPGFASIFTSSTASDHRSGLNAKAQLRRADRLHNQPTQEAR
ncbi:hypothetical protein [Pseudomonas chlororaphis]|uniref:hypothetical protein n=1 Tax=Pseudomonas chlororaphis TaxID=587753 RepID=UPI0004AC0BC7|nr:hypothetical protein [Pseudomonas chlororaphis]AIC21822.1 hypothetical protein EY04_23750 [Pseudomonas chlororaphis]WDG71476.1 type II toxin-antitoxin system HicA family toxin [Pseudomonas chlororaphis]WDH30740.1 type II toxin-antitoxin system HicA family toxin [Pseudomonas chlororaphis]WDH70002.1 type II toxin-antitoxin system HicA family toxin [Pseudomonas chlororaphis]